MAGGAGTVRVVVADRRRAVAEVLANGLQQVGVIAHAVTSMADARALATAGRADAVIADMGLLASQRRTADGRVPDGLGWGQDLPVPLIVLADGERQDGLALTAVRAGVRGWVPKDSPLQHLLVVIRGVLRDETWIPPQLLTRVIQELVTIRDGQEEAAERLASLTAREREVLSCLCEGLSRPEIGRRLFLSTNTVRTHVQNVMIKLDVHSSVAAVALANRVGLPKAPAVSDATRPGHAP